MTHAIVGVAATSRMGNWEWDGCSYTVHGFVWSKFGCKVGNKAAFPFAQIALYFLHPFRLKSTRFLPKRTWHLSQTYREVKNGRYVVG